MVYPLRTLTECSVKGFPLVPPYQGAALRAQPWCDIGLNHMQDVTQRDTIQA